MVYGYARVSTKGQAKDGNSLESQSRQLREAKCDKIYQEAFTGTKESRPVLDALISKLKRGDKVVVTKLDRVARSARGGIYIIDAIVEKGASIEILNMGKFDDSAMGKLMRTMMFAFSEFERDMIVERTMEGKKIAKLKADYHEGRPRKDFNKTDLRAMRYKQLTGELTVEEICLALGISRASYYNKIKGIA